MRRRRTRSDLALRVVLRRLVTGGSVEEVFGAASLVFVLELRHALDQRVELFVGQVRHERPNSCLEITPQCIKPTIQGPISVESKKFEATSVPRGAPMTWRTHFVR